jgi:hypothetical protein
MLSYLCGNSQLGLHRARQMPKAAGVRYDARRFRVDHFLVTGSCCEPTMRDKKYRPARGKQCATVVDRFATIRQHARQ